MSRRSREKVRKCIQIFLAHLFSHVGLCAFVVAYAAIGALVFEFLEAEHELQKRRQIQGFREDCMQGLWNITENMTSSDWENWITFAGPLLKDFENQVVTATKMEGYDGKDADNQERQWSFSGALLYCVTVITTIGYGNLAPKTSAGKIVTMIYALFGIPLMLLFLSNIGTLMAKTFQFAFARLCCSLSCCHYQPAAAPGGRVHYEYYAAPMEKPLPTGIKEKDSVEPIVKSQPPSVAARKPVRQCDCVKPILVDDKDLPQFDYEILPSADNPVTNGVNYRRLGVFYGFDRLSPEAKVVLEECTEYLKDPLPDNGSCSSNPSPVLRDHAKDSEFPSNEVLQQHVNNLKRKHPPPTTLPPTDGVASKDATVVVMASVRSKAHEKPRVPVTIVMAFVVGYVCVGAVVFSAWEEWSFLDGAYFSFITLSTIGFGDLVPGSNVLSTETHEGQAKFVICCLYLIVGLAIIAMSFNLVQEEVVTRFKKIGTNIGILDEK